MKKKADKLSSNLLSALYAKDLELLKSSLNDSDVTRVDSEGRTLLHHAVLLENTDIVEYLIFTPLLVFINSNLTGNVFTPLLVFFCEKLSD